MSITPSASSCDQDRIAKQEPSPAPAPGDGECDGGWEHLFEQACLMDGTSEHPNDDTRQVFEVAWKARGEGR